MERVNNLLAKSQSLWEEEKEEIRQAVYQSHRLQFGILWVPFCDSPEVELENVCM